MELNKIFIHRKDLSYSEVKESDSDITFIRKDALLEWAEERKRELLKQEFENDEPSDVAAGINAGFDMIIGKLNSM